MRSSMTSSRSCDFPLSGVLYRLEPLLFLQGSRRQKTKERRRGACGQELAIRPWFNLRVCQESIKFGFSKISTRVAMTQRLSCGTSSVFVSNGIFFFFFKFLLFFYFYTLGMQRCYLLFSWQVIRNSSFTTRRRGFIVARYKSNCIYITL